jgi:RimJ/RimL family protein N-acetyltransferase
MFPSTVTPSAGPSRTPSSRGWRIGLPVLQGAVVALRELRASDAPALLTAFGSPDVTRLISPPPPTLGGFEKFVAWTQRQREAGQSFAFGITLKDTDTVVGLFQVRALQPAFDIAEWGFALSGEHWGSGLFMDAAELILAFVFDVVDVHRLEARAASRGSFNSIAARAVSPTAPSPTSRTFCAKAISWSSTTRASFPRGCWAAACRAEARWSVSSSGGHLRGRQGSSGRRSCTPGRSFGPARA